MKSVPPLKRLMPHAFLPLAIIMMPIQPLAAFEASNVRAASEHVHVGRPVISHQGASFAASSFNRWRDLKARARVEWAEHPAASENAKRAWTTFIRRATALENHQKVDWVNSQINEIAYIPDKANWGTSDFWATPLEFIERGGDCEDYAIAKYNLLREAGFPEDQMKIAVTKDHAVLLVSDEGTWSVLDNRKKRPYQLKASVIRRINYTINDVEWSLTI